MRSLIFILLRLQDLSCKFSRKSQGIILFIVKEKVRSAVMKENHKKNPNLVIRL